MSDRLDTFYEYIIKRGYTRRDFLKLCTILAASIGLDAAQIPQVAKALETKPRTPVIYLNLQECTCCMESFIKTAHPLIAELILQIISLDYSETLQAAAGQQAEAIRLDTIKKYKGQYLVMVEGSVPLKDDGIYCTIGGVSARELLLETARDAMLVIAYGSCATNTCASGAHPNPTGAVAIKEVVKDTPVIDVPGCPPIMEVIAGTIVHYLTFGSVPLTNLGRPRAFYDHRIHDNCNRRAYFDSGLFVEQFDDEGAKQGWCLYKVGCKGPVTYNACPITQWNNGVSYPIKSGHPCIACSEPNFFDLMPIYERRAHIPGTDRPFDADQAGKTVTALTAGGVLAHGAATAVINRRRAAETESEERGDE